MKKLSVVLVLFVAALLLTFTAAPIAAQVSGTTPAGQVNPEVTTTKRDVRPQWGAEYTSVKSISAWACAPVYSTSTYGIAHPSGSPTQRYCTGGGGCYFFCPVDLPSGAQITGLEVQGCDTSNTEDIVASLWKNPWDGAEHQFVSVSSGTTATDGCSWWYNSPASPETVDNYNSYFVQVFLGNNDATTTFNAVLVYYKLQISPAPGTASFNDVPIGHPFFQEIEAMYASGITQGCPYPNFCPNNYVTRQEMAAFFARALGLNWYH